MLFLDETNVSTNDLITSIASWNQRYIHESSHWARFHGSSIGVLLVILRRTRDLLAAYTLQHLDTQDIAQFSLERLDRASLFSYSEHSPLNRLGEQLTLQRQDWLDLHFTYQILLDPEFLGSSIKQWPATNAIQAALEIIWHQSSGDGMLPRLTGERGSVRLDDQVALIASREGIVSTRLLFECAAVLDEVLLQVGSFSRMADPALLKMLSRTFDGEYGLPYRFAEELAGRKLDPITILTLIDFAINPVVPGLHSQGVDTAWREIYPPLRFAEAALAISSWRGESLASWPSAQVIASLQEEIADRTGIRMGMVLPELSAASSLSECATRIRHHAQLIPDLTLFYSSRLLRDRRDNPHLLSHYGLNFIDSGALRFVNPTQEDAWWIFPPLRVKAGRYSWPMDRINIDEATNFFFSSAISSAYDDAVHGVGPLSREHLPSAEFEDDEQLSAFNAELRRAIRFPLSWSKS
ncbi:hypothetical protein ACFFV7_08030 [Nonomuraea spiralis]|uniref:Uncharacterized protein n=2 Tax=Nonomuraea spiralis TaxID=46182 RepID=A0ABV5I9C1_9ACTN|nr:hypothetical protein [Nonomuraea spiralis]